MPKTAIDVLSNPETEMFSSGVDGDGNRSAIGDKFRNFAYASVTARIPGTRITEAPTAGDTITIDSGRSV